MSAPDEDRLNEIARAEALARALAGKGDIAGAAAAAERLGRLRANLEGLAAPAGFSTFRLNIARLLCPPTHRVVPWEPTRDMCTAATLSLYPDYRPTEEWMNGRQKHRVRYQAMITAYLEGAMPKKIRKSDFNHDGPRPWDKPNTPSKEPDGCGN